MRGSEQNHLSKEKEKKNISTGAASYFDSHELRFVLRANSEWEQRFVHPNRNFGDFSKRDESQSYRDRITERWKCADGKTATEVSEEQEECKRVQRRPEVSQLVAETVALKCRCWYAQAMTSGSATSQLLDSSRRQVEGGCSCESVCRSQDSARFIRLWFDETVQGGEGQRRVQLALDRARSNRKWR
jgi:hypothetical protein